MSTLRSRALAPAVSTAEFKPLAAFRRQMRSAMPFREGVARLLLPRAPAETLGLERHREQGGGGRWTTRQP
jgi:hypothetical protein